MGVDGRKGRIRTLKRSEVVNLYWDTHVCIIIPVPCEAAAGELQAQTGQFKTQQDYRGIKRTGL